MGGTGRRKKAQPYKISHILGTHVKKLGCSRSFEAPFMSFQPQRSLRVDLT